MTRDNTLEEKEPEEWRGGSSPLPIPSPQAHDPFVHPFINLKFRKLRSAL